jgi:molybdopterin converting factor small subunit
MAVEVLFFGQLTDKTGCSREIISNPGTIAQLKRVMGEQYTGLQHASYVVALNNRVAGDDENIPEGAVLAFMPPYSGG